MRYKIVFLTNYYDGPLEGLINYEGKELWFYTCSIGGWLVTDFYDDDAEDFKIWQMSWSPRIYKAIQLSWFQIIKRKIKHQLFLVMAKNRHYSSRISITYYKLFGINPSEHEFLRSHKTIGAFSDDEYIR